MSHELELSHLIKKGGEFVLDTDACDVVIGVALHQVQDGVEKVLRCASLCLNQAKRYYCTNKREEHLEKCKPPGRTHHGHRRNISQSMCVD